MSLDKLNATLMEEVRGLTAEGRAKAPERVIVCYVLAKRIALDLSDLGITL